MNIGWIRTSLGHTAVTHQHRFEVKHRIAVCQDCGETWELKAH